MSDTLTIGLISDTHGLFRPGIREAFRGVQRIVHAGDVGDSTVLTALRALAPVDAVSGNVDDRSDPRLPLTRTLAVAGLTLHVSHGDELGRPRPEELLARYRADVIVFGHTHRPLAFHAPDGRWVVNPGAAGPRRFDLRPTVARLTITGREVSIAFVDLDD